MTSSANSYETATPRTDAEEAFLGIKNVYEEKMVRADFARQLERELTESRANADDWMRRYGATQGYGDQSHGPKYGDGLGATHWEDCWRAHHGCAIAKIERDAQSTATSNEESK